MSKIVQAVNAMISNHKLISNVVRGENEVFFLYKEKYKWSMAFRDGSYYLWYYPGNQSLEDLSQERWDDDIPMVSYKDADIGTKEAKASFAELYTLVKEKVYGVDEVLDDIIGDDDLA